MSDSALLDFMDDNGVQCWPERYKTGVIRYWVAQMPKPFIQVTRATLRGALEDAWRKFEEHKMSLC